MSTSTIISCAVTGGDDIAHKFKQVPVTPQQVADAVIESAKAGAAIAHIHVRHPETGKPSMELQHYREVVERVRASDVDIILNLTTGPGARFVPGLEEANTYGPGSNVRTPAERVRHILALKPEICSLDMGSLNFGRGALINTPAQIEAIVEVIRESGTMPELEIFEPGHLALALKMQQDGLIPKAVLFQFALGIPWGAPSTVEMLSYFKGALPPGSLWSAFGVGRTEFTMVAQSLLMGGHVRVGLEDNLYLSKGVQAESNGQLVDKAVNIIQLLGGEVATTAQARTILGLTAR